MGQDQRIFQPILTSSEKDSVFIEVAASGAHVYIKLGPNKIVCAKALKWISPFKLQVQYPEGPRPLVQGAICIQVECHGEKYFAQAMIQENGSQFFLVVDGPIYKVQRRQSFRLKLPTDYPAEAHIFELNGHGLKEQIRVLDISEGGCSLAVSPVFSDIMSAYIGINIKIGNRPTFTLYGHVRYLKSEKYRVRLGVKFDQDKQKSSELFNLTRDLYVELFSKWARRK